MAERNLLYYALNNKTIYKKMLDENLKFSNQNYIELIMEINNNYLKSNSELKMSSLLTYYINNSSITSTLNSLIDIDLKLV